MPYENFDARASRFSRGAATYRSHGRKGLLPKWWSGEFFPSSPRRGGCAIKIRSRSILRSRRRGGVQTQQTSVEFDHHPDRSIKEASRYLIEVAATPPRRGGENCALCIWATRPFARGYTLSPLRSSNCP